MNERLKRKTEKGYSLKQSFVVIPINKNRKVGELNWSWCHKEGDALA